VEPRTTEGNRPVGENTLICRLTFLSKTAPVLRTAQYTRDNFLGRKVGASQTRITKVTLWLMHASEGARKGRPIPLVIWWPLPGVLVRRIPARLGQDTWSSGACAFPGDEDESGKV
jgi:hypothetical protein